MKKKTPARSLFRYPKPNTKLIEPLNPEKLLEHFRPTLEGLRHPVEVAIAKISRAAELAATNADVPDGPGHATRIASRLQDLRAELESDAASKEQVAYTAMKLTEAWMELRMDAIAAKSVRADEGRANRQKKVTDAQIEQAVKTHKTQADQSAVLGISDRAIRLRRQKRK